MRFTPIRKKNHGESNIMNGEKFASAYRVYEVSQDFIHPHIVISHDLTKNNSQF